MKNNLKLKMFVGILIICITLAISNISRAYSANADLLSASKLESGKDVKVTLTIKDIDADDGIRSITIGKVSYDTNVFEPITASSFVGENGWSATYSTSSGKLAIINGNPMTANNSVVTLTLKAKEGITEKSTQIKFENIVVASSSTTTGNIQVGTKTVTVYEDRNSQSGSEDENQDTNQGGTKANTTTSSTKNNKNITTSKSTSSKLPKAGDASTIAIATVAVILLVIAIVGFIKYTKQKDIK